jgi:rSAM/selenodomain-associated transferase 2
LNSQTTLPGTLIALVEGAMGGLVKDVVVVDGGSTDQSLKIADEMGATIIEAPKGRGTQLAAGARHAKGDWLLFLHSDTVLEEGWEREAARFLHESDRDGAAVFRFALADKRRTARRLEKMVDLRNWLFALPYGDQGLLISRSFYEELGGFADIPLMEDVDIVRRIGRRRLTYFETRAFTSAARYMKGGYLFRPARNLFCLSLYFMRVPTHVIARIYG